MNWHSFIGQLTVGVTIATAFSILCGIIFWLIKPRLQLWITTNLVEPVAKIYHQTNVNQHESEKKGLPATLHDRIDDVANVQIEYVERQNRLVADFGHHIKVANLDRKDLKATQAAIANLETLFQNFVESQAEMWRAIEAVAKAEPPRSVSQPQEYQPDEV